MESGVARFAEFELDSSRYELRRGDHVLKLEKIPMDLLTFLVERNGQLVTRDQIIERIWGKNVFLDTEHGINTAIRKVRQALGDDPEQPRFVQTVTGKGYRFIAPLIVIGQPRGNGLQASGFAGAESPAIPPAAHPTRSAGLVWRASLAILALSLLASGGWRFFSGKVPALTEKDTIVLADFTNTTGDALFDDTLKQALATTLAQSPFLNILSDQRVSETLRMMERSPGEHITPDMAREICQRTGSTAVLAGSIANLGSRYVIGLKATNCSNGDSLVRGGAQASRKEEVLNALGKAASTVREKLGESLASIQKFDTPVEQATTSSLEALKAYSLAVRAGGATPYTSLLQHAIELDPNFALAYRGLSDYYDGAGEAELASEYAQKAFDHRDHATEPERLEITATYYYAVLGDLDRELTAEHILEQMYPRGWAPWNDAAASRLLLGDYTGSLREGQEALRLNPHQSDAYLNPGRALLALNRRDEVKEIVQRARAQGMDVTDVHILAYEVAFLENDSKEMEAQLAPLLGKPDKATLGALIAQSSTEAYLGRLRSSLESLERGLEIARGGNYDELTAQVRDAEALRQAEFGNCEDARQAASKALTLSSGRNARVFTALALARAGDAMRAQALADELGRQFPSHSLVQRYWLPTIRGSIELARKNPAKAVEALKAVSYELGDTGTLAGNLYPAYVRGQAYLGTRQGKEAAAEFQKFLDHRSIVSNSPLGALARLGLARAYSLQGDTAKSRAAYQDFLALWKQADSDVPVLKEARAEYAKLQPEMMVDHKSKLSK